MEQFIIVRNTQITTNVEIGIETNDTNILDFEFDKESFKRAMKNLDSISCYDTKNNAVLKIDFSGNTKFYILIHDIKSGIASKYINTQNSDCLNMNKCTKIDIEYFEQLKY